MILKSERTNPSPPLLDLNLTYRSSTLNMSE
uniref:Uncharacterized protein n=1 Tax=viral metagenome TaxID=1070528 RepID=A0A6C0BL93_9ZZZZ